MMIALDGETTGLDLRHGCKPYIITICNEEQENTLWRWQVDPETRQPQVLEEELGEIWKVVQEAEELVFLNPVFDIVALAQLDEEFGEKWPWEKTHDIGLSGHLLHSIGQHNLTTMAMRDCMVDLRPLERRVGKITKEARNHAKREYPHWRIAKEGLPELPSCKGSSGGKSGDNETVKLWKNDMWVPLAIADEEDLPENHRYRTAPENYANGDTSATVAIRQIHKQRLKERKLTKIYEKRRELLPVMYKMNKRGVSFHKGRATVLRKTFEPEVAKSKETCIRIAQEEYDYDLEMPKGSMNNSLAEFVFGVMQLDVVEKTDNGNASLNKAAIEQYLFTLPQKSNERKFIECLSDFRKGTTHLGYLSAYERFSVYLGMKPWFLLHPSLNPNGSDTLRWSSANPNSQNVSKKGKYNLRRAFGPAPGREWWSMDAKNIELRIPAYESKEVSLIDLFERSKEPPYYGSEHLLNFSVVYPDIWEKHLKIQGIENVGPWIKENLKDSWYQYCKNGNFAVGYGAIDRADGQGTADKAYHRPGSHARLTEQFAKKEQLNQKYIRMAEELGYVETLPDKSVDPKRGYPLICPLNKWGGVLQTTPLNYHVQSSAMWITMRAMIIVQNMLDKRNKGLPKKQHAYLIMQVHDEIVLDFPKEPDMGNQPFLETICDTISQIGFDFVPEIPLPFGLSYHPKNWAEEIGVR